MNLQTIRLQDDPVTIYRESNLYFTDFYNIKDAGEYSEFLVGFLGGVLI